MATTIQSSSLDFDAIKNNLKTYLQQQKEFKDYDFDASGLNNLLDVLAYNTHLNGLTANMALNESFLNTAQLRSSVVSHAETLGYIPASKSASQAVINMSFNVGTSQADVPEKLQISSGYKFTANVNDASYTFQTQELIEAINDGNNFFQLQTLDGSTDIPIKEGIAKTKTFFAGEDSEETVYIIPDVSLDRATAIIKVFDSSTSSDFTTYINLETANNITATTPAYILKEAPNGYYELTFGNGSTLGAVPKAGAKITVEYLSVDGENANGARLFEPLATVEVTEPPSGIGLEQLPLISTVNRSVGGAQKETLDSIRRNSPFRYASQNRMVTHSDYSSLILRSYGSYINDIIAWGGEDNVVPEYGMAFLSVDFKNDINATLRNTIKDNIKVLVDQLSIASFGLKFSDPIITFLETNVFFQYNPDYTNLAINTLQENVKTVVANYYSTNIGKFGQAYRRSSMLALVDDVSPAILSSRVDTKMQQVFTPSGGVEQDFTFSFPVPIAVADDINTVVNTSTFLFLPEYDPILNPTPTVKTCRLENKLSTNTLQVIESATGGIIKDNAGSFNAAAGTVTLTGFKANSNDAIKLSVSAANASAIVPTREYILKSDNTRLSAKGIRTTASN
jgi:hypothetical protein